MAAPTDVAIDTAVGVSKMAADKIQSQELILALFIVVLTATMSVLFIYYGYKFIVRLADAFKEISGEISSVNLCLAKVVEVQSSDHSTTIRNQDLLKEQGLCLTRIETSLNLMYPDLKIHAKECRDKERMIK